MWYFQLLIDSINSTISGFLIKNLFYGEIAFMNGTIFYFEDIKKFPELFLQCPYCYGILYLNTDIINVLSGKSLFQTINSTGDVRKLSIFWQRSKNLKNQFIRKTNKRKIHCELFIWVLINKNSYMKNILKRRVLWALLWVILKIIFMNLTNYLLKTLTTRKENLVLINLTKF